MFCSQCGRPIDPENRFCGGCGSDILETKAESTPAANSQPQPERIENKSLKIALVSVPLFVLLLLVVAMHNATPKGKPPAAKEDKKTDAAEAVRSTAAPLEEHESIGSAPIGQEDKQPSTEPESGPASIPEQGRVPIAIQGWASTSILGFTSGEPALAAAINAQIALVLKQVGDCRLRKGAAGFTDCKLSNEEGESMDESLYHGYLQGFRYKFKLNRYDAILEQIKRVHGAPRILGNLSNEWGGPADRLSISLSDTDVSDMRKSNDGGRTWEHISLASVLVVFDPPKCASSDECMPTQDLIDERRYTMQILRSAEDMLSAPSFAARVKIYCRDQIYASRSRVSVEEVEARYAKLMRTEPSTKEEEVQRQYKLQAFRETLAADHENVSVCQGAITAGYQGLLLTSRSAKKPASPESV